jgi:hypothetical protein
MPNQTCIRCGWVWEINISRNTHETCDSCRTRKQYKVRDCIVWHGNFDTDLVTPIDSDGNPLLAGIRKCGNSDCVNPSHVERKK